MTKIKICGIKRKEDIEYLNELKPDFAGFVFAGTKRKIDFETAAEFRSLLDKDIRTVGVFVNERISNILNFCENGTIDYIQLHGDEDEAYIYRLKEKTDKPIIRTIKVKDKVTKTVSLGEDHILFDTYSEKEYGGSGKSFDLDIIKDFKGDFFLAGGLNKNNIKQAIEKLNPFCIDLSSGVETNDKKDFNKIKEVIDIVREEK